MSRLQNLLELKKINSEKQSNEANYFMDVLYKYNLALMGKQARLDKTIKSLREIAEKKLPDMYHSKYILGLQKKIMELNYEMHSVYVMYVKVKHLLKNTN